MSDRLPRADRAIMAREKLEGYLLNPLHEVGRHKARVFASALGIEQRDWEYLRDELRAAVLEIPARNRRTTKWGELHEVVVPLRGLNDQTRQVVTVWLVEAEEAAPRFVTAYVAEESAGA